MRKDLVEAARAEELSEVRKMQVWRKVRREEHMIIDKNEYPHENQIIKDIGSNREADDRIESMRGRCHAKFNSRNEFLEHLAEQNHMVISEGDEDDHINRVANNRGSRQLSRSDRKFKQLFIHKQENFEEAGSIGN